MPFTNKTAIVTGAGGGMGLNIARDLLAGGARVTMIDLKRERPPDLPVDRALYLIGDVTEETFIYKAIAHAFHETGRLDYVVNAAGVLWFDRDCLQDENVKSALRYINRAIRHVLLLPLLQEASMFSCRSKREKPQTMQMQVNHQRYPCHPRLCFLGSLSISEARLSPVDPRCPQDRRLRC